MTRTEAAANLRQLATDMRAAADWLIRDWRTDKAYSHRGYELLTAAYVVTYWADEIDKRGIKNET